MNNQLQITYCDKTKKYLLAPERAILISSEQNISLRVISKEPWIGINISCRDCPLLKIG